jgi:serine/threonine protein kinase
MTADQLITLLIRSRLHSTDAVKLLFRRWLGEAKDNTSAKEFAEWLIRQKEITEYQAKHLLAGHADTLFLDEYRILERIGKGRMAGVYLAQHTSGQRVALKVLPPSKAKDADVLARFQRESKLATQLNHANIVRTHHAGEANGLHYLVMEYVEGDTLAELLKERGRLPAREAVRIAFLAALGLQHVHEKEMVHRDLKPGNLMLSPYPAKGESTLRSMVKLMDIGLGRSLFVSTEEGQSELTTEGELIGTPDYLAPEQARDARKADIRSDIYSLGCTLYHALAGQPPFPDDNSVRQVIRHATEEPRPLRQFNPDTPDGLQQIVERLLAKDPAKRYQSPTQVAEALKAFLAAENEPGRTAPAEQQNYDAWLNKAMAGRATPAGPAGDSEMDDKPVPIDEDPGGMKRVKAPTPTAGGFVTVDVEPINETELHKAPFGLPFHRDVFMIAVGATGVLLIVLLGWLISLLFGGNGTPGE